MSIQKYKALLMTVETGSITAAAQKLGYTQSAVSKMIQDLEQEWNMELLSRSRKGIELTSEGLTVIPAVRDIISDYENLQFSLTSAHGLKQGTLRLGSFASVFDIILAALTFMADGTLSFTSSMLNGLLYEAVLLAETSCRLLI